jgi:glycosyltransferase involved in cell wall biosynthesis
LREGDVAKRLYSVGFLGKRDDFMLVNALCRLGALGNFYTDQPAWRLAGGDLTATAATKTTCKSLFLYLRKAGISQQAIDKLFAAYFSRAVRKNDNVRALTYQPYVEDAKTDYPSGLDVFYYHPDLMWERQVLFTDFLENQSDYPMRLKDPNKEQYPHYIEAYRKAERILCASRCTKKSLMWRGVEDKRISVIPYFYPKLAEIPQFSPAGRFKLLFVGQLIHRKGVHHLLKAWSELSRTKKFELTIVTRDRSGFLLDCAREFGDIRLLNRVSRENLQSLYFETDLFVMPSLVEGFGHVYAEALRSGCPVLGGINTGLPDLAEITDGVFIMEDISAKQIVEHIESCYSMRDRLRAGRKKRAEMLADYSFSDYTNRIADALGITPI